MAFRGQHEHSLDSKDRLTVPRKFRAALDDGYVLAKGPDACLWLYTTEDFEKMEELYIEPHSILDPESREVRRMLNSTADDGTLDSAGRVRIPATLKAMAGLDRACTVVGTGKYIEIWDSEQWARKSEQLMDQFAETARNLGARE